MIVFSLFQQLMPRLLPAVLCAAVTLNIVHAKDVPVHPVKPPAISVITAATREIVETRVLAGSLAPREEIIVAPEIDGLQLIEVLAEAGDRVAAGQVLARLSRTSVDVQLAQNDATAARALAAVAQARSQIQEADASLLQAENALQRTVALQRTGSASNEQYDLRYAAARSQRARLAAANDFLQVALADQQSARAARRELDVRLARTDIRSPQAGIVSRRTARLGAIVTMAGEPLFRIIADGVVEFDGEVPEQVLPFLKIGQMVLVTPAGATRAVTGKVRLISPEVDRTTRLGRVRITLGPDADISIGGFARGVVEIGRRTGVALPLSAIAFGRDGATTQVVVDGKVASRRLETGLIGGGYAEILQGVAQGETVVARAGAFLRDGDVITPVAEAKEAAAR